MSCTKGKACGGFFVVLLLLFIGAVIGGLVAFYVFCDKSEQGSSGSGTSEHHYTSEGEYFKAAVATDAANCSKVGRDILKKGGSAVDGAIASMLCVGVINMHSVGVGGGGVMLVYNRTTRKAQVVDFREMAPANASRDMFVSRPEDAKFSGRAIAVPGEVRGYLKAWRLFGRLPWRQLVQPAIDIARTGFAIGKPVYETMEDMEKKLRETDDPGLRELLFDANKQMRKENDVITNLKYAATLEMIRDNPEGFYTGELSKNIVRDMAVVRGGGLVTPGDLRNYSAILREALENKLGGLTMHTTPAPTSGPVIALILNILKGYNMSRADLDLNKYNASALTLHRIIEAFKFAYAWRTHLADPAFVPNVTKVTKDMMSQATADHLRSKIWDNQTHHVDYYADFYVNVDHGTSHLSVLDQDGNAVAFTSTINLRFGCLYRSTATGIIYNNQMYDFDNPSSPKIAGLYPSSLNFPAPGKRPLSSVTPLILTDSNGDVKLVVGASGGKKIITATSLVVMNKLWFGRDLFQAVNQSRVHNHLVPNNTVQIEKIRNESQYTLPEGIQAGLRARGHEIEYSKYYAAVQAIYRTDTKIYAKSDPRKHGAPAGF